MDSCAKCGATISKDWVYCHQCGAELIHTSQEFSYDQLFELVKLEETRREYLDSKASTYIGLLTIAVTVLTASGGIITIRGGPIQEITNPQLGIAIYILYIFIIIFFVSGVFFTFRSYSIGTIEISSEPKKNHRKITKMFIGITKMLIVGLDFLILPKKGCYKGMPVDYIATNSDEYIFPIRKELIPMLKELININWKLNNEKSNCTLKAYRATILGIVLLLVLTSIIGVIGIMGFVK